MLQYRTSPMSSLKKFRMSKIDDDHPLIDTVDLDKNVSQTMCRNASHVGYGMRVGHFQVGSVSVFFCFLLITFTYSGNNTALSKITIPKEHSKAETACGKVPYTNHKDKVITLNIHFVLKMGKASSLFMFQPFKILFADKIYLGFFFFSLFLCYC